ncbi:MAG: DUF488 domain-containing protein [Deltaproteobacteria bacterium]|nr:DUF488 domain-containing protein [Deltaproteobacteria bacterium]
MVNLTHRGIVTAKAKTWQIATLPTIQERNLPQELKQDCISVIEQFSDITLKKLIDYVYVRHPWFTINSLNQRMTSRPIVRPAIFSMGYQGLSIDGFLNTLFSNGLKQIIDVRANPVSRVYGFHKTTLMQLAKKVLLDYRHFPQVGISSEQRSGLSTNEDYEYLLASYNRKILPAQRSFLTEISLLMSTKPSVLLCFEADPAQCHRSRLASALAGRNNLPLRELRLQ